MTTKRLLIADCDETIIAMLPGKEELGNFTVAFTLRLAKLPELRSKITWEEMKEWYKKGYARIDGTPHLYGWLRDGVIVASACDELLKASVIAGEILDSCGALMDPTIRHTTIQRIFKESYPFGVSELKPGAAETLNKLRHAGWSTEVVTNAPTSKAQTKLANLFKNLPTEQSLTWLLEHVHGDADKWHVIEPEKACYNQHLQRPIPTERPRLFRVLDPLCAGADKIVFIGDNADMDLHPGRQRFLHLNPICILIANSHTPVYDLRYFSEAPNCFVVRTWQEVEALLNP